MISIYFLPPYLCQCLSRQEAADCFKSPASPERRRLWKTQPALRAISAVTSTVLDQVLGEKLVGKRRVLSRVIEVPGFKPSLIVRGRSKRSKPIREKRSCFDNHTAESFWIWSVEQLAGCLELKTLGWMREKVKLSCPFRYKRFNKNAIWKDNNLIICQTVKLTEGIRLDL